MDTALRQLLKISEAPHEQQNALLDAFWRRSNDNKLNSEHAREWLAAYLGLTLLPRHDQTGVDAEWLWPVMRQEVANSLNKVRHLLKERGPPPRQGGCGKRYCAIGLLHFAPYIAAIAQLLTTRHSAATPPAAVKPDACPPSEAFRESYKELYKQLVVFAEKHVWWDVALTEDLLQEVFVEKDIYFAKVEQRRKNAGAQEDGQNPATNLGYVYATMIRGITRLSKRLFETRRREEQELRSMISSTAHSLAKVAESKRRSGVSDEPAQLPSNAAFSIDSMATDMLDDGDALDNDNGAAPADMEVGLRSFFQQLSEQDQQILIGKFFDNLRDREVIQKMFYLGLERPSRLDVAERTADLTIQLRAEFKEWNDRRRGESTP
jgi:hypothetical protein